MKTIKALTLALALATISAPSLATSMTVGYQASTGGDDIVGENARGVFVAIDDIYANVGAYLSVGDTDISTRDYVNVTHKTSHYDTFGLTYQLSPNLVVQAGYSKFDTTVFEQPDLSVAREIHTSKEYDGVDVGIRYNYPITNVVAVTLGAGYNSTNQGFSLMTGVSF